MYDDHLEIINPGTLRFGFTPEILYQPHESRPCNPLIANVFYRAGVIERWGTGTLNIIDWCRDNGNPEPEWLVDVNSVALVFYPVPARPESQLEPQLESLRVKVVTLLSREILSKSEISIAGVLSPEPGNRLVLSSSSEGFNFINKITYSSESVYVVSDSTPK